MKKTMLLLAFIATVMSASAHFLIPFAYCASSNKVTLENTQFTVGAGKTAYFYITKNGSQTVTLSNPVIWSLHVNLSAYTSTDLNDSVGAITTAGFKINIPQPANHNGTGVVVYSTENDQYGNTVWTTGSYNYKNLTNVCISLPITFSSISAIRLNDSQVEVDFTVATVSGVNTVNVQISFDNGNTYETRAIIFPDGTLPNKSYRVIFNSKQ